MGSDANRLRKKWQDYGGFNAKIYFNGPGGKGKTPLELKLAPISVKIEETSKYQVVPSPNKQKKIEVINLTTIDDNKLAFKTVGMDELGLITAKLIKDALRAKALSIDELKLKLKGEPHALAFLNSEKYKFTT